MLLPYCGYAHCGYAQAKEGYEANLGRYLKEQFAFAFAEIYSDPPLVNDMGFDGEFADDKICPRHSGKYCPPNQRSSAIGQGILTANASNVEMAMVGPGWSFKLLLPLPID